MRNVEWKFGDLECGQWNEQVFIWNVEWGIQGLDERFGSYVIYFEILDLGCGIGQLCNGDWFWDFGWDLGFWTWDLAVATWVAWDLKLGFEFEFVDEFVDEFWIQIMGFEI